MNYLLNLSLPLYFMLLPLGIAVVLAAKLYQWQSIFSKVKANYQAQLREAQNRLDEANKKEYFSMSHTTGVTENYYQEAHKKAEAELKDLTEKCHKLESDAVEREALIVSLNAKIDNLLDSCALRSDRIRHLESKIELCEKAHIETQTDLDGERYYLDAVAEAYKILYDLVKRNSRTRKQYDGAMKSIGEKRAFAMGNLNRSILELAGKNEKQKQANGQDAMLQRMKEIRDVKAEKVVHDSLGNARVFQADQSESVNNRHTVVNICNEVNRGITEQAERIRQELEVVDMSQLKCWDSVKLRCGAVKVVKSFTICNINHDLDTHTIKIHFADNPFNHYYDKSGNYEVNREDPMDIIKIIKA